ncbi:hypothetical protein [Priestia megaterium]
MSAQINDILSFYFKTFENSGSNEDLTNVLKEEYGNNGDPEFFSLLINNFIMVQSEIMRDLKEINKTIRKIDLQINRLDPASYKSRKLKYCKQINMEAKEEIEVFLIEEAIEYIKKRVIKKKKWERTTKGIMRFLDVLPYKYSHFKRYYNPNYDFSTDTKYRFLHHHNPERLQPIIDLKSNNLSRYYEDLEQAIKSQSLLDQVINGIKAHHVLKKRDEIFETLNNLYTEQKYQSFVNLAVIQVEGLFYDFCYILNDEKEVDQPGTLSVKAERVFSSNPSLWLSMYPYFAFDAPIFRNKIAHNGLWDRGNVKDFANELIFDLYAIINAIKISNKLPYNLFEVVLPFRSFVQTLEYSSQEDYSELIVTLFSGTQGKQGKNIGAEFFNLLKQKDDKRDALEFYPIQVSKSVTTNLYEECGRITKALRNEKFWDEVTNILYQVIEDENKHELEVPNPFIDFVDILVKSCISTFSKDSVPKKKCIEIKKILAKLNP